MHFKLVRQIFRPNNDTEIDVPRGWIVVGADIRQAGLDWYEVTLVLHEDAAPANSSKETVKGEQS